MGPGYSAHFFGILLLACGVIIGVRGAIASGESVSRRAMRPLRVLGAAVTVFASAIDGSVTRMLVTPTQSARGADAA